MWRIIINVKCSFFYKDFWLIILQTSSAKVTELLEQKQNLEWEVEILKQKGEKVS